MSATTLQPLIEDLPSFIELKQSISSNYLIKKQAVQHKNQRNAADVVASDGLTGSAALGGDWGLVVATKIPRSRLL